MSWHDMDNGNIELYYAMVNILDWYCKDKKRFNTPVGTFIKVTRALGALEELSGIHPQDIADANDGGEVYGWTGLMGSFEKLWEKGERI